jgi:glutamine amidotransferase
MCRLFGLRANRPVDVEFSLVSGPKPFREFGKQNPSGWGIGWYEDGAASVKKEPLPAHQSPALNQAVAEVKSAIVLAHVRFATCGDPKLDNCHPFSSGNWLFAHNGGVDRYSLWAQLDGHRRTAVRGDTDSEVLFHWILQHVEREGDIVAGLRKALPAVRVKSAVNFLLSDGSSLYAYRNAVKSLDRYSLFYLLRNPHEHGLESLQSKEVGALLRSKALHDEKAILVCSERLTSEDWKPLENGRLLVITESLVPNVIVPA